MDGLFKDVLERLSALETKARGVDEFQRRLIALAVTTEGLRKRIDRIEMAAMEQQIEDAVPGSRVSIQTFPNPMSRNTISYEYREAAKNIIDSILGGTSTTASLALVLKDYFDRGALFSSGQTPGKETEE